MNILVENGKENFKVIRPGHDLSIPLNFNGEQPNTYGVPKATSSPYSGGGFIGDTRQGGPCNFETVSLTPHCNGTHTEGVGHISLDRIDVLSIINEALFPASIISLKPVSGQDTDESYSPDLKPDDQVITARMLKTKLDTVSGEWLEALVIRTLPNHPSRKYRDYMTNFPPFFTFEAMEYICGRAVQHLLVDFPSVDKLYDEGKLSAHHIFWEVAQGSHEVRDENKSTKTITEFIFVPDKLEDSKGLLNLQMAPFVSDASPSRPVFYSLEKIEE